MMTSGNVWSIPVTERTKYDQIFDGLQPINGLLTGEKVKPVLLNSKLPIEILGRVWELSDIDADGFLDREEFTVAMHLVYRALERNPVPLALPVEMIPPSKRVSLPSVSEKSGLTSMDAVQELPVNVPILPSNVSQALETALLGGPMIFDHANQFSSAKLNSLIITPSEKVKYDELFRRADTDMDGLVNGLEIKDIFLQTGLPQMTLAHIWNLCDINAVGKLNCDQFALAMHLVQQKLLHGAEPPTQLSSDMIPLSMQESCFGLTNLPVDTTAMKELNKLLQEIEDLKREKMRLEQEKSQKEADLKIQNGEVATLQKELDSINLTVIQLSTQKGTAQLRLDELDDKRAKLENSIADCKEKFADDLKQIKELQNQILSRESIVTSQQAEIKKMRDELSYLRLEESDMKVRLDKLKKEEDIFMKRIADAENEISQTRRLVHQLKEVQESMRDSFEQDDNRLKELKIQISTFVKTSNEGTTEKDEGPRKEMESEVRSDIFRRDDPFGSKIEDTIFAVDSFSLANIDKSDPFDSDPFSECVASLKVDECSQSTCLTSSLSKEIKLDGEDPWGATSSDTLRSSDKFESFGFHGNSATSEISSSNFSDPFGTGSFTPASSSATWNKQEAKNLEKSFPLNIAAGPVLPPKQKKAPAPPRPPAPKPSSDDPMGGKSGDMVQVLKKFEKLSDSFENVPNKLKSEAEQLAWATHDSQKEWERQKQLRDQEQADLELAIALSKQ